MTNHTYLYHVSLFSSPFTSLPPFVFISINSRDERITDRTEEGGGKWKISWRASFTYKIYRRLKRYPPVSTVPGKSFRRIPLYPWGGSVVSLIRMIVSSDPWNGTSSTDLSASLLDLVPLFVPTSHLSSLSSPILPTLVPPRLFSRNFSCH